MEASFALPLYDGLGGRTVRPEMVQATAANTGRHPVGVTGLALGVTGGGSIPFMESVGGTVLPAVLQRGEHVTQ